MYFDKKSSKLIIKNISRKTITLLKTASVVPGAEIDLIRACPGLSEATILDGLRAPDGSIYIECERGNIEVLECNLFTLNNSIVDAENLNTSNDAAPGSILSLDESGDLCWNPITRFTMDVSYPLFVKDGKITLQEASDTTSGYLTKEEYRSLKNRGKGVRVWQYQDFAGPQPSTIYISSFQNGASIKFHPSKIVNGSAFLVRKSDLETQPLKKISWFKHVPVEVLNHTDDKVLLSSSFDGDARLYFVAEIETGEFLENDFEAPPYIVRKSRIDMFDSGDFHLGEVPVKGKKEFIDSVQFSSAVKIGGPRSTAKLDVDGVISAKSISLLTSPVPGFVMTANAVGEAAWKSSPTVEDTPPQAPYAGQVWVRKSDYSAFIYDYLRGKWLGLNTDKYSAGLKDEHVTSNYLEFVASISSGVNSIVLPCDCTLVGLVASASTTSHWTAEILADGRHIPHAEISVNNNDRAIDTSLNVDFSAGSKLQIHVRGVNVNYPIVECLFRMRA